jgi:hypothetical protein
MKNNRPDAAKKSWLAAPFLAFVMLAGLLAGGPDDGDEKDNGKSRYHDNNHGRTPC